MQRASDVVLFEEDEEGEERELHDDAGDNEKPRPPLLFAQRRLDPGPPRDLHGRLPQLVLAEDGIGLCRSKAKRGHGQKSAETIALAAVVGEGRERSGSLRGASISSA